MEEEYSDVDWGESDTDDGMGEQQNETLQIELTPQKISVNKSRSTVKVVYSDSCYDTALRRHQNECKSLLSRSLKVTKWSKDESVSCLMLSLLPNHISSFSEPKTFTVLNELCNMFIDEFQVISDDQMTTEEGRDGSSVHDLEAHVIANRAGSAHQLTQLFYCLLSALGFETRYICTLDPDVSPLPQDHDDLYRESWEASVASALKKSTDSATKKKHSSDSSSSVLATIKKNNSLSKTSKGLIGSTTSGAKSDALSAAPNSTPKFKARKSLKDVIPTAWVEVRLSMPRVIASSQFEDLSECDACDEVTSSGSKVQPSVNVPRWVHVDAVHKLVDQPRAVEVVARKGLPVRYVVGVERRGDGDDDHFLVDVTARYKHVHRHSTVRDRDIQAFLTGWFRSTVDNMNTKHQPFVVSGVTSNSNSGDGSSSSSSRYLSGQVIDLSCDDGDIQGVDIWCDVDLTATITEDSHYRPRKRKVTEAQRREDEEQLELSARRAAPTEMPSRVADFKDHPVYLLERHLLADEALHPDAKLPASVVGVFRGEPVYLQRHREKLRCRAQWRREMRCVLVDEAPIKSTTRKKMYSGGGEAEGVSFGGQSSSSSTSKADKATFEIRLFGSWQTEPMQIEPVTNGVIPMNEYGNVEIWEGRNQFVPRGGVFLDDPAGIKAAKSLGLPFAPAVTGFENKGQHTIPRIGGVVVLKEHEQLVLDAMFFLEAVREEDHYEKKDRAVHSRWKRLVSALMSRQRLRNQYGH